MVFNVTTRTEPFKTLTSLAFNVPREERRPLIKCTEWTLGQAIPTRKEADLMKATLSWCDSRVGMNKSMKYLSKNHAET